MRLTRHRRTRLPSMNMTPMIDVVFLLLIFFMTVSQVSEVNRELLELPKLEGSEDQKPTLLTINVTRDGELKIGGETVTFPRLITLVDNEINRLGGEPRRLAVVLRTDERATSRATNEAVRSLGRLGVDRVRIAVEATAR